MWVSCLLFWYIVSSIRYKINSIALIIKKQEEHKDNIQWALNILGGSIPRPPVDTKFHRY